MNKDLNWIKLILPDWSISATNIDQANDLKDHKDM